MEQLIDVNQFNNWQHFDSHIYIKIWNSTSLFWKLYRGRWKWKHHMWMLILRLTITVFGAFTSRLMLLISIKQRTKELIRGIPHFLININNLIAKNLLVCSHAFKVYQSKIWIKFECKKTKCNVCHSICCMQFIDINQH